MGDTAEPLTWRKAQAEALAFHSPARALATSPHPGPLPGEGSWISALPYSFIVTACKPPEEGRGLVVRGYNPSDRPTRVVLRPFRPFAHAVRLNLNEEIIQELMPDASGQVVIECRPKEIVTFKFFDG